MNRAVVFFEIEEIPKVQRFKNALWKFGIMNVLLLFNSDPFSPAAQQHTQQSTRMREKSEKSRIFLLFACCVGGIDIISPLRNACLILWCSSLAGNKSMSIGVEVFRIETEKQFQLCKKHEKFLDRIELDSFSSAAQKRGKKTFALFKRNFLRTRPPPLPSFVSEIFHQYLLLCPK